MDVEKFSRYWAGRSSRSISRLRFSILLAVVLTQVTADVPYVDTLEDLELMKVQNQNINRARKENFNRVHVPEDLDEVNHGKYLGKNANEDMLRNRNTPSRSGRTLFNFDTVESDPIQLRPDGSVQYVQAVKIPEHLRDKFGSPNLQQSHQAEDGMVSESRGYTQQRRRHQYDDYKQQSYPTYSNSGDPYVRNDDISENSRTQSSQTQVRPNRRDRKISRVTSRHRSQQHRLSYLNNMGSNVPSVRSTNRYNIRSDAFASSREVTTFKPSMRYPVTTPATPTEVSLPHSLANSQVTSGMRRSLRRNNRRIDEFGTPAVGILNPNLANAPESAPDPRMKNKRTQPASAKRVKEAFSIISRLNSGSSVENTKTSNPVFIKAISRIRQSASPRNYYNHESEKVSNRMDSNVKREYESEHDVTFHRNTHSVRSPKVPKENAPNKRRMTNREPKSMEKFESYAPRRKSSNPGKPIFQDPRTHPEEIMYYNALEDEIRKSSFLTESVRLVSSDAFSDLIQEMLHNKSKTISKKTRTKQKPAKSYETSNEIEVQQVNTNIRSKTQDPLPKTSFNLPPPIEYSNKHSFSNQNLGSIDEFYNFKNYETPTLKYRPTPPWKHVAIEKESDRFADIQERPTLKYQPTPPWKHVAIEKESDRFADLQETSNNKRYESFIEQTKGNRHKQHGGNTKNRQVYERRRSEDHSINNSRDSRNNYKRGNVYDESIDFRNSNYRGSYNIDEQIHNGKHKTQNTRETNYKEVDFDYDWVPSSPFKRQPTNIRYFEEPEIVTSRSTDPYFDEGYSRHQFERNSGNSHFVNSGTIGDYSKIYNENMGNFMMTGNIEVSANRRHDREPSFENHREVKSSYEYDPVVFTSMPYFSSRTGTPSEATSTESSFDFERATARDTEEKTQREDRQKMTKKPHYVPTVTPQDLAATPSLSEAFMGTPKPKTYTSERKQPNTGPPKSSVEEVRFPRHGYNIDGFFDDFPEFGFFSQPLDK